MFALKGFTVRVKPQQTLARSLMSPQMTYFQQRFLKNWNAPRRKAKTWKMTKYPCIPNFMQTVKADPFDYQLQTKQQVSEQLAVNPKFEMDLAKTTYNKSMTPLELPLNPATINEVVPKITFDLKKWPMSSCQRERFIYLLGPRYRGKSTITLRCKQYTTYDQNLKKLDQTMRELVLESLRAPNIQSHCIRSAYAHDRFKRAFGRTREERVKRREAEKRWKQEALEYFKATGETLQEKLDKEDLRKRVEQELKDLKEGKVKTKNIELRDFRFSAEY